MARLSMIEGGPSGGTGTGGTFIPGTPNQYDPAYGGIPRVPSPTGTAAQTIMGNLGNLQNLYGLATGTGAASGAGAISALNQEIPGVSGSIGAATGNINELLSGKLPEDVITQLRQQSAEIGAGQGMGPMSPFSNASYLRALGLTSLGMKQQGQQALDSLMGSVPRAPAFDPSSMLVNPGQAQEWQYLAQMMANAPVPAAAAKANLQALQAGAGYGGGSPVGGFNVPVHGGPAFSSPNLTGDEMGAFPTYSGTGVPTVSDPYANWNALQNTWTKTSQPSNDAAMAGQFGMTPEEYQAYLSQPQEISDPDPYGYMYGGGAE